MLTFKNKTNGLVVKVTEEFAEQVLRPQGKYEEIFPVKEVPKKVEVKVAKKKAKKKSSKKDK